MMTKLKDKERKKYELKKGPYAQTVGNNSVGFIMGLNDDE